MIHTRSALQVPFLLTGLLLKAGARTLDHAATAVLRRI